MIRRHADRWARGSGAACMSFACAMILAACARAPISRTTLSDPALEYSTPAEPYVVLERGGVRAVVVDNSAVDDDVLPGHRAGYSGVASLSRGPGGRNLFVPAYAGLNFEHIHDGTTRDRDILFEPRRDPMELRVVDPHTVELYQRPTSTWGLESATRYELLEDGAIEMTIEVVPSRRTFTNGYIGLFWAGYINQPESLDIHFIGRERDGGTPRWVRGVTPEHGVDATHVAAWDHRTFAHDDDFPLTLVFNRSPYVYERPCYYGVSHGMALVYVFSSDDRVRMSQSPSGGGEGNPAWDFQWFIDDYEVDRVYRLRLRVLYVPYESPQQIERLVQPHLRALNS